MKLIRTLIDAQRSYEGEKLRPSQIAAKPRAESDVPVSEALSAQAELPDALDEKLQNFKSDYAELRLGRNSPIASCTCSPPCMVSRGMLPG